MSEKHRCTSGSPCQVQHIRQRAGETDEPAQRPWGPAPRRSSTGRVAARDGREQQSQPQSQQRDGGAGLEQASGNQGPPGARPGIFDRRGFGEHSRAGERRRGEDAGALLMHRNRSYVFFSLHEECDPARGPIGGQGISLTALRSIAVDRAIWTYGLPFWIAADLPWRGSSPSPFRRLMIAQDTGSAITGPARADIFFGSGDDAGARAGDIRHAGDVVVLLPAEEAPDP